MKQQVSINIKHNVYQDIKKKKEFQKFDFTSWVNQAYEKEFLQETHLKNKLEELTKMIDHLRLQLDVVNKNSSRKVWENVSEGEKEDLSRITIQSRELWPIFNRLRIKWGWTFGFQTFSDLVREHGRE